MYDLRESDTTDTLQGVIGLVTKEVGGRVLHDLEGLDLASVLNMGSTAQINQSTAAVHCRLLPSNQLINVMKFVLGIGEHLLQVLLGHLQTVEALLLLEDFSSTVIERLPVGFADDTSNSLLALSDPNMRHVYIPVRHSHVVEETLGSRGTVRQKTAEFALACLTESVGRGMPENLPRLIVTERKKKDCAVTLQGTVQIPKFSVNLRNNHIGAHILGHVAQERSRSGFVSLGGD